MQPMQWRDELADIAQRTEPLGASSSLEDAINQTIKSDLTQLRSLLEIALPIYGFSNACDDLGFGWWALFVSNVS
jgi:hypothetical protein